MPSIQSAFPSKYLREPDLNGSRVAVTISHLALEDVARDGEDKPVLYFHGKKKGVVLNKTRAKAVTKIAGTDDYTKWGGVDVVLFPSMTVYKGEETPCIGIAAPGSESQPKHDDDDSAPF